MSRYAGGNRPRQPFDWRSLVNRADRNLANAQIAFVWHAQSPADNGSFEAGWLSSFLHLPDSNLSGIQDDCDTLIFAIASTSRMPASHCSANFTRVWQPLQRMQTQSGKQSSAPDSPPLVSVVKCSEVPHSSCFPGARWSSVRSHGRRNVDDCGRTASASVKPTYSLGRLFSWRCYCDDTERALHWNVDSDFQASPALQPGRSRFQPRLSGLGQY
ncbi:hypothetical protein [Herbaspirillum sp. ST 5-3]|uniref:hypothetical protein n=1 Tax=Noviherbaspirillum sp. ST 5-3 TaxID=3349878 RepID=UPI0014560939